MKLLALIALLALAAPAPKQQAPDLSTGRYRFDEIVLQPFPVYPENTKTVDSPPGSFERDYRWARLGRRDPSKRDARLTSVAYFDGWSRVQTYAPYQRVIQFGNVRKSIVIEANPDSHTYRKYTGSDAAALLSPKKQSAHEYYAAHNIKRHFQGTTYEKVTTRYFPLPSIRVNGITGTGRRIVQWRRWAFGTQSCRVHGPPGNFTLRVTEEYRAKWPEPRPPYLAMIHDEVIGIPAVWCHDAEIASPEPLAQKAFDRRFLLYSRQSTIEFNRGKPTLIFLDITERGHIRNLTATDWNAMQLPGSYADKCRLHPKPDDCRPTPAYGYVNSEVAARSQYTKNIWSIMESKSGEIVFSEHDFHRIGRLTPGGDFREILLPQSADPAHIAGAADGTTWFSQEANGGKQVSGLGYVSVQGGYHQALRLISNSQLSAPFISSDGTVWFVSSEITLIGLNKKLKCTLFERKPDGTIIKRRLGNIEMPSGLAVDAANNVWLADYYTAKILRISPSGETITISLPDQESPSNLIMNGDRLWFSAIDHIGFIDGSLRLHNFTVPRTDSSPNSLAILADGDAVYGAEHRIGIVTPGGRFREFRVFGQPQAIFLDSRGNLWYADPLTGLRVIRDFQETIQKI